VLAGDTITPHIAHVCVRGASKQPSSESAARLGQPFGLGGVSTRSFRWWCAASRDDTSRQHAACAVSGCQEANTPYPCRALALSCPVSYPHRPLALFRTHPFPPAGHWLRRALSLTPTGHWRCSAHIPYPCRALALSCPVSYPHRTLSHI
jgi:hypothetical protein